MGVVDDSPIEIADIHHIYSHHRALKSTVVLPCWLRTPETPEVAQNDANEECRVPSGDKRRRKKRRERYPDAIRQQRCREADDRHAAFVPLISRYQNDAGLRQQVSALASSRRCEVDTAPPRSDWILLGSMSSVVQPTCVLEHSCAAVPPGDRSCASPSHEGAVEGPLYGHDVRNESDVDVVLRAGPDARVIMPPRSAFVMSPETGRVSATKPLELHANRVGGFTVAVVDPPWENASAKRARKYPTLPSAHLLSLPMRRLLDPRGAVVALWLPNRERHWRFALGPLAEAWGVSPIAQWAWLKTDAAGEPVVDVASAHRRPYEPILVLGNEGAVEWCRGTGGKAAAQGVWEERAREGMRGAGGGGGKGHGGGLEAGAAEEGQGDGGLLKGGHGAGTAEEGQGGEKGTRQEGQSRGKGTSSGEGREERGRVFEGQLPGEGEMPVPTKLLVCPPAQHSRKPYLGFALAGLARGAAETGVNDCGELTSASGEPRCLELFARELRRGWMSWGCEVLAFQEHTWFECRCERC